MANPKGQPGNRSRTGMPKPTGSGTPKIAVGEVTNFTFRIGREDLAKLDRVCKAGSNRTKAYVMRELLLDYLDRYDNV